MADPFLLGIEIGGTKLQIGVGHGDGRIVAIDSYAVEPNQGSEGIRRTLEAAAIPLLARIQIKPELIVAVGIGFGGPVDSLRGAVLTSNQIGGWSGYPLADWAKRVFHVERVAVENDADTAALAEARFGAGLGISPVLYVQIGSGIGGGLIVDDEIYRGNGVGAVEIGHLWVSESGRLDDPGQTIEGVASGWSMAELARLCVEREFREGWPTGRLLQLCGGDPSKITAQTVAEAAKIGDPDAARILSSATTAVATGLAHAVNLLSPRRIILGGGVSQIGEDLWLGPIRRELDRRIFPPFKQTYDLVPSSLGQHVVIHGALAIARYASQSAIYQR